MIEDIKYPIYSINIDWIQDDINLKDEIRDKEAYTYRDLPDGRCRNRMRHKNMYKEIQDEESLKEEYHTRFMHYLEKHNTNAKPESIIKNISDLKIIVNRNPDESWVLEWFSHYTFDIGQSDEEVLQSFERYVRRYEHFCNYDIIKVHKKPGYLELMGAEDRWRWKGVDNNKNETPPPCRCEGCKKSGIIRIIH